MLVTTVKQGQAQQFQITHIILIQIMQDPGDNVGIDINTQRQLAVESNGTIGTNHSFQSRIRTYKTWVDRNCDILDSVESRVDSNRLCNSRTIVLG